MSEPPRTSHLERTATQTREAGLHRAKVCYVRNINPRIRLIRLAIPYAIKFHPGQWLDLSIPSVDRVGGFTITSSPADASGKPEEPDLIYQNRKQDSPARPYFELAIQNAPKNPPAAWFWRDKHEIMNQDVDVRVGGSFVWPPKGSKPRHALFVAGGVGINPLMSMISHLADSREDLPKTIKLLYSTRLAGDSFREILFFWRLRKIFRAFHEENENNGLQLYLTDTEDPPKSTPAISIINERISESHLIGVLPPVADRAETAAYVCGPPAMTDGFVSILENQEGMKGNVFCEKWW